MTLNHDSDWTPGIGQPRPWSTEVLLVVYEDHSGLKMTLVDFTTQRHVPDGQQKLFNRDISLFLKEKAYDVVPVETASQRLLLILRHEIEMHRMNHPFRINFFEPVKRLVLMEPEQRMDVSAARAALAKFQIKR